MGRLNFNLFQVILYFMRGRGPAQFPFSIEVCPPIRPPLFLDPSLFLVLIAKLTMKNICSILIQAAAFAGHSDADPRRASAAAAARNDREARRRGRAARAARAALLQRAAKAIHFAAVRGPLPRGVLPLGASAGGVAWRRDGPAPSIAEQKQPRPPSPLQRQGKQAGGCSSPGS